MPDEHAEELIAHTGESCRYAEQLFAAETLDDLGREPTRRGGRPAVASVPLGACLDMQGKEHR